MAKDNSTSSAAPAESAAISEMIRQVNLVLLEVVALGASIRNIALALPITSLDTDEVLCPEIVFPSLGKGVIEHIYKAFDLLEELEMSLKGSTGKAKGEQSVPPEQRPH